MISEACQAQVKDALRGKKLVERFAGDDAQKTAVEISKQIKGASTCIVATSGGFWDALSVSPYAYATTSPIYLTDSQGNLRSDTLAAIKAGGYKRVVIAGGPAAVSSNTEKQLTGAGISQVIRRQGADAYGTSQALAEWEISQGLSANHMGVATISGYWDALTGGALCGKAGGVLVLADDNFTATLAVAKAHKASIGRAYVFGGEAAVGKLAWADCVASTR